MFNKTDTSTGTTGKPTEWVRGEPEMQAVKRTLSLASKFQFGSRPICYINAFAFGPWATGLTTYEFMRECGSVFATGPDKEKIIDKIMSIAKDEAHQLDRKMATFASKITPSEQKLMRSLIAKTLSKLMQGRDLPVYDTLSEVFHQQDSTARRLFSEYQSEIVDITTELNHEKQQIIITGYPPFLKDILDEAKKRNVDFKSLSIAGIVGGQASSEAMRDKLISDGFSQIVSSYGASDLDINIGVESTFEIEVRKGLEHNPGLARELFGENKGLPMIFHYDPLNYHIEANDDNDLIFTCTRNDRSSPRVRYNLGDKGRVYASSDVQAIVSKYGIFQKPMTNLPLVFIWGRDSTVVFNGANLAFTELERAVTTNDALENAVLKKAFYKIDDEHFEMWFELKDDQPLPTQTQMEDYSEHLFHDLAGLNQDFRYQLEKLGDGALLPTIRFFKRGESPISEAGGHRKQVLIFEKGVNLPKEYQFPDESKCCSFAQNKSASLLEEKSVRSALSA